MEFVGPLVLPSGITANVHVVDSIELLPDSQSVNIRVSSWGTAQSKADGYAPETRRYSIGFAELSGASELLTLLKNTLVGPGGPMAGATESNQSTTLAEARERKNRQINVERLAANRSTFSFAGKQIACDELSRSDIDGVSAEVALTGALPATFPGIWKAVDNTFVSIPDVATFTAMVQAMVAQGASNFLHAQALKTYIYHPSRTIEEIEAVGWDSQV